jgi:hypothetical protein
MSAFSILRTRSGVAAGRGRRGEAGTSLVETLIAAGILLVVAVSIFPMFHRAVANNVSGGDSSQATQHGRSRVEGLLARSIDNLMFDMKNPADPNYLIESEGSGSRMTIENLSQWDDQAKAQPPADPGDLIQHFATGVWVGNGGPTVGLVIWERTTVIRQYSYADIGEGVIDVSNPGQIVAAGHPNLFDSPLASDAPTSQINFREHDVTVSSRRAGVPPMRVRLVRTH